MKFLSWINIHKVYAVQYSTMIQYLNSKILITKAMSITQVKRQCPSFPFHRRQITTSLIFVASYIRPTVCRVNVGWNNLKKIIKNINGELLWYMDIYMVSFHICSMFNIIFSGHKVPLSICCWYSIYYYLYHAHMVCLKHNKKINLITANKL